MNELHVDENHRPLLNVRIKHTVILEDPFEEPKGLFISIKLKIEVSV